MTMTEHAEARSQQRGISHDVLQIVMKYGRISLAPGGTYKLFFGNKEYANIVYDLKMMMKQLERAKGGTIIFGDDRIVTVYKQN